MKRILITGAAGAIGTTLRAGLAGAYALLRLTDVRPIGPLSAAEEFMPAELGDPATLEHAMSGIDCVVHLGGIPREAEWQSILDNNIAGTCNVFEAARKSDVRRVVFASSNNTRARWRNAHSARIGYAPQDNAEDYAHQFSGRSTATGAEPADVFHGGDFCALEFTGNATAID